MKIADIVSRNNIVRIIGSMVLAMMISLPVMASNAVVSKSEPGKTSKPVTTTVNKLALTSEDLILKGLSQGMSKADMIALLGITKTTENFTLDHFTGGKNVKFTKYNYAGISVTILDMKDRIMEVDITNTSYKTARGIKVGDPLTKVKELYGEEDLYSPSRMGEPFFVYTRGESPEALSFKIDPSTKKVVRISVDSWSN